MNLTGLVKGFFGTDRKEITLTTESLGLIENTYYQTLAIEASVSLIAKTLSRAEFKTFTKGKEKKEENYYLLNVEANQNKSSPLFWREVISKLLKDGEALILVEKGYFYLASEFERSEMAFYDNFYKNIKIGDYEIKEDKRESDVIYLEDDNKRVSSAIKGMIAEHSKMIASSIKGYSNSKARKGTLDIPSNYAATLKEGEKLQDHIAKLMKDFMDPTKDAVFPQTNKLKYTEISEAKGSKSNDSGRETKNFINDVFDFVAISYGIPPSLLKGDVADTEDAFNNFVTFCINPLAELIEDEINRKFYGKKAYLDKNYTKIDTSRIKMIDLREISNSIELLTRTGSNTIDDNLKLLGKEPIGGEIGESRYITKNLDSVENILEGNTK